MAEQNKTNLLDANLSKPIFNHEVNQTDNNQTLTIEEKNEAIDLQTQEVLDTVRLGEGVNIYDEIVPKQKKKKHHTKNKTWQKNKHTKKITKPKNKYALKDFSKWFKYSFSFNTSFANWKSYHDSTREYLKGTIIISPIKYLFLSVTFNKTINRYYNKYYTPDFSYSFGYSDWHQDTFGLIYSNYADNRFNPDAKHKRFNFDAGSWDLSYKTKYKDLYLYGDIKYIQKYKKGYISLKANKIIKSNKFIKKYTLSAKYKRYIHINQDQVTFSARGYLYKKFYVAGSLYLYSHLSKQTYLEPDYAYTFGWRDTRKGKLSIMYSNYYKPTRFNWRPKEGPSFDRGSVSLYLNF
ncbi:MAG: hypothetical protein DSZ09_05420 [Sulfurovum sp.]|nr:MAG: hypothetical protein DSZ09_05420 [Sulfurovum sp.]